MSATSREQCQPARGSFADRCIAGDQRVSKGDGHCGRRHTRLCQSRRKRFHPDQTKVWSYRLIGSVPREQSNPAASR
jgi:hypothetical protein